MIISHIPAGFITSFFSRKWWNNSFSKKKKFLIFFIGSVAAAFPDIDLLYYYLVDSESSHREFFTHSFVFYLAIFAILYLIAKASKNSLLKAVNIVFFIGATSHLLLDSFTAGVPWLYPLSTKLFGLTMVEKLNGGFYGNNIFVFTWTLELCILLIFGYLVLRYFIKKKLIQNFYLISSAFLLIFFSITTYYINQNLYHHDSIMYYGDFDNDGISNLRDSDMDGDGIFNVIDPDANGNGIDNEEEVLTYAYEMVGLWHDVTEDGALDMLSRLGFLSNSDVVLKSFDRTGIFLGNEMRLSYYNNSDEYTASPKEQAFLEAIVNLYTYCKNEDLLIANTEKPAVGDIVFYKNGGIKYVSLVVEVSGDDVQVIYGGKDNPRISKTNIKDIEKDLGEIFAFGRILK